MCERWGHRHPEFYHGSKDEKIKKGDVKENTIRNRKKRNVELLFLYMHMYECLSKRSLLWYYHVSILSYCSDTELKMTQVQVCWKNWNATTPFPMCCFSVHCSAHLLYLSQRAETQPFHGAFYTMGEASLQRMWWGLCLIC